VTLSSDGSTAIVGGWLDNNGAGAAWVFTQSAGVWSQQGSKLVGSGAVGSASQGFSVALSADGNTAVIGGFGDNNDAGAAWVFTQWGGAWNQQGSKLVGSGAVGSAVQGLSVALSSDGNTAIIGGDGDNNNAGAAWVFGGQETSITPPGFPSDIFTCIGSTWCLYSYGEGVDFSGLYPPLFAAGGLQCAESETDCITGSSQLFTTTAAFTFPAPPSGNAFLSPCDQSITLGSTVGFVGCGSGTTTSTVYASSAFGQLEAGAWLDASQYPMYSGQVLNGQATYGVAGGAELFLFNSNGPFPPPTVVQAQPTDSVARFTFVVHGTPTAQGVSAANTQTGFFFSDAGMPCPDYPCSTPAPTWAFYAQGANSFETVVSFDLPFVSGQPLLAEFNLAAAVEVMGNPTQGAQTYSAQTSMDLRSTATLARIQLFPGTPGNLGQEITNFDVLAASGTSYTPIGIRTNVCDLRQDGSVDVADVQLIVNEALGAVPAAIDLNGDGAINVVDAQIEIAAALGRACSIN
jgi:hypothetical protein